MCSTIYFLLFYIDMLFYSGHHSIRSTGYADSGIDIDSRSVREKAARRLPVTWLKGTGVPGRRQAIIWTNAGILLIGPLGTNFSEILIKIYEFSFKKIHLKLSSRKWRPSFLGFNVLRSIFVSAKYISYFPKRSAISFESLFIQI